MQIKCILNRGKRQFFHIPPFACTEDGGAKLGQVS